MLRRLDSQFAKGCTALVLLRPAESAYRFNCVMHFPQMKKNMQRWGEKVSDELTKVTLTDRPLVRLALLRRMFSRSVGDFNKSAHSGRCRFPLWLVAHRAARCFRVSILMRASRNFAIAFIRRMTPGGADPISFSESLQGNLNQW